MDERTLFSIREFWVKQNIGPEPELLKVIRIFDVTLLWPEPCKSLWWYLMCHQLQNMTSWFHDFLTHTLSQTHNIARVYSQIDSEKRIQIQREKKNVDSLFPLNFTLWCRFIFFLFFLHLKIFECSCVDKFEVAMYGKWCINVCRCASFRFDRVQVSHIYLGKKKKKMLSHSVRAMVANRASSISTTSICDSTNNNRQSEKKKKDDKSIVRDMAKVNCVELLSKRTLCIVFIEIK